MGIGDFMGLKMGIKDGDFLGEFMANGDFMVI